MGPRLPSWKPERNIVIPPIYNERPSIPITTQPASLTQTQRPTAPDSTRSGTHVQYFVHLQLYSIVVPPPQISKIKVIQAVQEQPSTRTTETSKSPAISKIQVAFSIYILPVHFSCTVHRYRYQTPPTYICLFHDTNNIETQPQTLRKDKARPQTRSVISPRLRRVPQSKTPPAPPDPPKQTQLYSYKTNHQRN